MIPEFSKNRSFIENEFEEANFDLSSGMNIDTLSEELVRFYNENQNLSSPILRAKCIEFILANAQIEINPRQIFADKMNIGVNYHGFAGADIYQSKIAAPRRHCQIGRAHV